ncbi:MAG: GrpB family protein [Desulfobacterales bacterium]
MIGLEKGFVRLIPYHAEWKRIFEHEKSCLQAAIGMYVLDIQHVGSTSVPQMVAKPIIDIAIAVRNFEEARACIRPIEDLGYEYRGENGIPRRHFFAKGNPRTHHIHMNEIDGQDWKEQILFRDYLTRNRQAAQKYAAIKKELARRYPTDRLSYTDGKGAFIKSVLQLARHEREKEQAG